MIIEPLLASVENLRRKMLTAAPTDPINYYAIRSVVDSIAGWTAESFPDLQEQQSEPYHDCVADRRSSNARLRLRPGLTSSTTPRQPTGNAPESLWDCDLLRATPGPIRYQSDTCR